jgi:leucyl aminopeptidase
MKNPLWKKFFCILLLATLIGCHYPVPPAGGNFCGKGLWVENILSRTSQDRWLGWIHKISGAEPVLITGVPSAIETRFSFALFGDAQNGQAVEYILQQVRGWVREDQIEIDPFVYTDKEGQGYTWNNIIITFPGVLNPEEIVIFSAHLDSITTQDFNPFLLAPGADDNGSGVATMLEAVRLFRFYRFARTIKVIFWTGEEEGDVGSKAYVEDHPMDKVAAVINMDMFAYDSNKDRCIELHVGVLPQSERIGRCFMETASASGYRLTYDYLRGQATDRSDHYPFWSKNVGAILVLENLIDHNIPGGCQGVDGNPYYHTPGDTVDKMDASFGFDVAQAGLSTIVNLAQPLVAIDLWSE